MDSENHAEAVIAYKAGLAMEPSHSGCQEGLRRAQVQLSFLSAIRRNIILNI